MEDGAAVQSHRSPANLESPVSVTFDNHGDLWIADEAAGRITEYVSPFRSGMALLLVIGQSNLQNAYLRNGAGFGEQGPAVAPTSATLCSPRGHSV